MKYKFLFSILLLLVSCTNSIQDSIYYFSGKTMGTTYTIKFTSDDPALNLSLKAKVNKVLEKVNNQMSTYIPTSELSMFNASRDTSWFPVSLDLAFVMEEALKVCKLSNGKFDITVGPVVNLWGFGPNSIPHKIPTDKDIRKAKKRVGYHYLEVRLNPPAIKKKIPTLFCDLSAIAKGFGVDKVSETLLKNNIKNHLVEIGGELRARGQKFGTSWIVGISVPNKSFAIQEKIALDDLAMATSGDYWNYFEKNGVRYSHTINPETGKPITHNLASVTVIDKSCMLADAYATAIDVMGPIEGKLFADKNELNVYFIVKEKNEFKTFYTNNFDRFILKGK